MRRLITTFGCALAAAGLSAGGATGATQPDAKPPKLVVPYLSHGAGVYLDRTGIPVPRPRGAPAGPAKRGVHRARRQT